MRRVLLWFPYVVRLERKITELTLEATMHESNMETVFEDFLNEKQATRKAADQLLRMQTDHKFETDLLMQRLDAADNLVEFQKETIRGLSEELIEYRRKYAPTLPVPAQTHENAPAEKWTCSCPRVHPFYHIACSVCSRTRPAPSTPSPPSA